jgi:serine protease Do
MRSRTSRLRRTGRRLAALLCLPLLAAPLRADDFKSRGVPAASLRRTPIVEVVEKARASVVNIHSERTVTKEGWDRQLDLSQAQQRVNGMGTGVVIDPRGYVITNHHVVDDVQSLRVRLHDGTSLTARIVARDPAEDLAVIKIDPPKPLPAVLIGTATDLMLGETVIAIGNAFGYEHTVSTGIVSALKRDVTLNREVSYKSLIQTDASINPGNSGGPLFNIHGELVGINVAIRAGAQGIGFAIPADTVTRVAADLLSVKRRTGVAHGLTLRDEVDASDTPVRRRAVVERIEPGSAAERSGLKPGDVLERAGDLKVACAMDVERAFLERPLGEKVELVARRGPKEEVKGELVLRAPEKVAPPKPDELVWRKLGVRVAPAPAEQVLRVNPQLHGGLLITEVNATSAAAKAGFQRGDILIGLHQWETVSLDNITFVVNHPDLATFAPLKFFRIRAGQLQRGWIGTLE